MLLDIFMIVDNHENLRAATKNMISDEDGSSTVSLLRKTKKVINRITGKYAGSIGLHPAVYFYNHLGRHSRFLFLGTLTAFAEAVRLNDKAFFHDFTENREIIENALIRRKSAINQALANIGSGARIEKVSNLIQGLVKDAKLGEPLDDSLILSHLGLTGKFSDLSTLDVPTDFSKETKSAANIRMQLSSAPKCPICEGLMDVAKAVSSDHILRKRDGGTGGIDNHQFTHPFCNSGVKG